VASLEDKQRGPKGQNRFETDTNLQSYIVAQIAGRPHISASAIYEGILANFDNAPSLRSVQSYVKKYRKDNASALLYAADPDKWKSHRKAAFGSLSQDVVRLNQKWEIDGTIADVFCKAPDGQIKRYSLVAIVDIFSRRAKVHVTEQPSAIATAACLRAAILDWGLPEVLKADNGKDYTAIHVQRIAADLGFAIDYCPPFSPEKKPHVERFYKTLSHNLFEIMPNYAGHSVADQQAIRSRRSMAQRHGKSQSYTSTLTPGELQIVINDWIRDKYQHDHHRGIKTTPFQKAAGQRTRMIEDERALDILLAPTIDGHGVRVVQKKGVSVYGRWFVSPELGGLIGGHVQIKIDVEDESRIIVFSAEDGRFICMAEDPTMTGADLQEIAARAKQVQISKTREVREQLKTAAAAHSPDKTASDILARAATSRSKVFQFRVSDTEASYPSMEPAADAAAALTQTSIGAAPLTPEEEAEAKAQIKVMEAQTAARHAPSVTTHHADPTVRPNFALGFQGDIDFWVWAQSLKAQGLLDQDTTKELQEMENDHTIQLQLLTHGVVTKDELRKKGIYK